MNANIKDNPREGKLWTGIVGKCVNIFSNDKSGLGLLNRLDHRHLHRALRSAPHYPAQSLLSRRSHAELQTQSERHSVIVLVFQSPAV